MAEVPDRRVREGSPLLDEFELVEEPGSDPREVPLMPKELGMSPKKKRQIAILLSLAILTFSFAGSLGSTPLIQIVKENVCHQLLEDAEQRELPPAKTDPCESDAVQATVAYLFGIMSTLDAVVGLIVAFPFGILADKIGRKPVILLSATGVILSFAWITFVLWFRDVFPVRLILLEAVFMVVGGGNTVVVSVIYSLIADIADEAERSTYYFAVAFSSLTGVFLGPILASKLMEIASPWLPMFITFIGCPVAMTLVLMIPETLPYAKQHSAQAFSDDETGGELDSPLKSYLLHALVHLKQSYRILDNSSLLLIIATCLARDPELYTTAQFFVQYVNTRFKWTVAEAGYLMGIRGVFNMAVLVGVLPALGKYLLSKHLSPAARDLFLARISIFFGTFGALFMAGPTMGSLVFGLCVNSLAVGYGSLLRSLAASFVDPRDTSKLNTLMSMVETIGSLFTGPFTAWLFAKGMELKGLWLGLPYFWLTVVLGLVMVALVFVRTPVRIEIGSDREGLDDDDIAPNPRYQD